MGICHAIIFVIGFSLVFIALGAVASSIGQLAGRHTALLSKVAGVVIIVFGRRVEVASGALLIVAGVLVFTHRLTTINSWLNDIPFVRRAAELVL